MQTKIVLFILFSCCCFYLSGQKPGKRDTFIVRSNTVNVHIPKFTGNTENGSGTSGSGNGSGTSSRLTGSGVTGGQNQPIISPTGATEGTVESQTTLENGNLKVVFSYQVNYEGHDFALGDYMVDSSIGLKEMLLFMKKDVEGGLADYLKPPGKVTITIKGGADATPINGPILYKSEFGPSISENCQFEGKTQRMNVTGNQVITDNSTLAFLRSVAAKDYITHNIFVKNSLQPEYYLSATVSPEKGGKYRRVSVEMIIHDVNK